MIHNSVLLLLLCQPRYVLRHARRGPLACDFDPICKELDGTVTGDIHVTVFGFRAVETTETCGVLDDRLFVPKKSVKQLECEYERGKNNTDNNSLKGSRGTGMPTLMPSI